MAGSIGFIGLGRMGRPMATNLLRRCSSLALEAAGTEWVPLALGAATRECLSHARAGGWGGKDFSALVDALCESRGAPPVRFAPERGRNRQRRDGAW